jgi:hypothetical protein
LSKNAFGANPIPSSITHIGNFASTIKGPPIVMGSRYGRKHGISPQLPNQLRAHKILKNSQVFLSINGQWLYSSQLSSSDQWMCCPICTSPRAKAKKQQFKKKVHLVENSEKMSSKD